MKEIEKAVGELSEKKSQVDSLFDIKKVNSTLLLLGSYAEKLIFVSWRRAYM